MKFSIIPIFKILEYKLCVYIYKIRIFYYFYFICMFRGMQKNIVKSTNIQIYDIDTIQGAIESAFSTLIPNGAIWPRLTCSSR